MSKTVSILVTAIVVVASLAFVWWTQHPSQQDLASAAEFQQGRAQCLFLLASHADLKDCQTSGLLTVDDINAAYKRP